MWPNVLAASFFFNYKQRQWLSPDATAHEQLAFLFSIIKCQMWKIRTRSHSTSRVDPLLYFAKITRHMHETYQWIWQFIKWFWHVNENCTRQYVRSLWASVRYRFLTMWLVYRTCSFSSASISYWFPYYFIHCEHSICFIQEPSIYNTTVANGYWTKCPTQCIVISHAFLYIWILLISSYTCFILTCPQSNSLHRLPK